MQQTSPSMAQETLRQAGLASWAYPPHRWRVVAVTGREQGGLQDG